MSLKSTTLYLTDIFIAFVFTCTLFFSKIFTLCSNRKYLTSYCIMYCSMYVVEKYNILYLIFFLTLNSAMYSNNIGL